MELRQKKQAYEELVEYAKRDYASRDIVAKEYYVTGCEHCKKHINLWSYWQGSLEAKILLIGQDWGNFNPESRELDRRMLINFQKMDADKDVGYFEGIDDTLISVTDKHIMQLFAEIGSEYSNIKEKNKNIFFTNLCLGYRNKGYSKGFRISWLKDDLKYLIGFDEKQGTEVRHISGLLEILMPEIVICLGKNTYSVILDTLQEKQEKEEKNDLGNYNQLLNEHENCKEISYKGKKIRVYGMAHPGGMGTANRNRGYKSDSNEKDVMKLQKDDWREIGKYLQQTCHEKSYEKSPTIRKERIE